MLCKVIIEVLCKVLSLEVRAAELLCLKFLKFHVSYGEPVESINKEKKTRSPEV